MSLHARYDYVNAFIDTLVNQGVRHVIFSPGSRSTPLLLHAANNPKIQLWRHIDERSAGFFALGMSKIMRQPAVLICTSGTAAANYFPSIMEAKYGRIPLIILTADRPHEARDNASPQEVNQIKMYGDHVKWFTEMPIDNVGSPLTDHAIQQATRAVTTSREGPAGPVHLNFPFRDPLIPTGLLRNPDKPASYTPCLRPDRFRVPSVIHGRASVVAESLIPVFDQLLSVKKGLIICGPQDDPDLPKALLKVAKSIGYPLLADPLSGLRTGHREIDWIVDAYDTLFTDDSFINEYRPDLIVRFGGTSASKSLNQFIRDYDGPHIFVDPYEWRDPHFRATHVVRADPVAFCDTFQSRGIRLPATSDSFDMKSLHVDETSLDLVGDNKWVQSWMRANAACRRLTNSMLESTPPFFEGRIFLELSRLLPESTTLYVGNSMPIRDVDTFFPSVERSIEIVANRGANGIDGVLSSALGAKAVSSDPLCLVIGDLSFYHDLGALLTAKEYGMNITIILVNNDGGGIFSFLPQAELKDDFEYLFGTPHGLDFEPIVKGYGATYTLAKHWEHFSTSVRESMKHETKGIHIIEVQTDRQTNVLLHDKIKNAHNVLEMHGEKFLER